MSYLENLLTVIVISARDLSSIPRGIQMSLDRGINVIIARPLNLPRIDHLKHPRLKVLYGDQSFFARIHLCLIEASTPYIFLSADDDYLLIDNIKSALEIMQREKSVTIAAQTLYCLQSTNRLSFTECYNHFKYSKPDFKDSPQHFSYNLFNPLSVDFYTIYDRTKLSKFFGSLNSPDANQIWGLDLGMKAIQFFFATFISLLGPVSVIPLTLYIRDRSSRPLRIKPNDSSRIHPNLSLSDDYKRIRHNTDNYKSLAIWSSDYFSHLSISQSNFVQIYLLMEHYSLESIRLQTYTLGVSNYTSIICPQSDSVSETFCDPASKSISLVYQLGCPLPHFHDAMLQIYPTYFMSSSQNRFALKAFAINMLNF